MTHPRDPYDTDQALMLLALAGLIAVLAWAVITHG